MVWVVLEPLCVTPLGLGDTDECFLPDRDAYRFQRPPSDVLGAAHLEWALRRISTLVATGPDTVANKPVSRLRVVRVAHPLADAADERWA